MPNGANGRALAAILGDRVIVRYTGDEYIVNPEGTGTRELCHRTQQMVKDNIAFAPDFERFPQLSDKLMRSGIPFEFQGL